MDGRMDQGMDKPKSGKNGGMEGWRDAGRDGGMGGWTDEEWMYQKCMNA